MELEQPSSDSECRIIHEVNISGSRAAKEKRDREFASFIDQGTKRTKRESGESLLDDPFSWDASSFSWDAFSCSICLDLFFEPCVRESS